MKKVKWVMGFLLVLLFFVFGTTGRMAASAQDTNTGKSMVYQAETVHSTENGSRPEENMTVELEIIPTKEQIQKEPETVIEPAMATESAAETANQDVQQSGVVFIGDSRTEAFVMNAGLKNIRAFTDIGMTVESVFTKESVNLNGRKVTVMEALKQTDFERVYIMLGINETGWVYDEVFIQKYREMLDAILEINPNADIYVQSILPVSEKVSDNHPYITNERINRYNELIREMASEKGICYLDVAEVMRDEKGALPEDAAPDGIHVKKEYCLRWLEYLQNHS